MLMFMRVPITMLMFMRVPVLVLVLVMMLVLLFRPSCSTKLNFIRLISVLQRTFVFTSASEFKSSSESAIGFVYITGRDYPCITVLYFPENPLCHGFFRDLMIVIVIFIFILAVVIPIVFSFNARL